jgi:hypothetical protein
VVVREDEAVFAGREHGDVLGESVEDDLRERVDRAGDKRLSFGSVVRCAPAWRGT